jgi:hypothetical protein
MKRFSNNERYPLAILRDLEIINPASMKAGLDHFYLRLEYSGKNQLATGQANENRQHRRDYVRRQICANEIG